MHTPARYTVAGLTPDGKLAIATVATRFDARRAQFQLLRAGVRDIEVTDTRTGIQL